MTAQMYWMASLMTGVGALVVVLAQMVIGRLLAASKVQKRSRQRLEAETTAEPVIPVVSFGPVENLLIRAGIPLSPARAIGGGLLVIALIIGIGLTRGWIEAGAAVFFVIVAAVTLWRVRYERQRRQIFEELPGVLDSMLRSISVGRGVEVSVVTAFADASAVFQPMVFRLRSAVGQGRDYTLVLDAFADLYQIPALTQMAIAFRTSARFGSSIQPVLKEVAKAIRSRQELRREFMAATAETRFTAVVFAILPPGLAAYMVLINEQFSEKLLESDAGHTLLMISGGFQLLGILLILNLIRGVGRA